jgi:hypothetical protein
MWGGLACLLLLDDIEIAFGIEKMPLIPRETEESRQFLGLFPRETTLPEFRTGNGGLLYADLFSQHFLRYSSRFSRGT